MSICIVSNSFVVACRHAPTFLCFLREYEILPLVALNNATEVSTQSSFIIHLSASTGEEKSSVSNSNSLSMLDIL